MKNATTTIEPLPPGAALPLLLYRLVFPLLFILMLPAWLLKMRRRERGRASLAKPEGYHTGRGQRLGHYDAELAGKMRGGVWLHSISVGETFVALKLARQLRANGVEKIIVSVTTATAFEIAVEAAAREPWLVAIYNPVDLRSCVRRALHAMQPERVIFIEGELWPNLLDECRSRGVPVSLANARMSPRSERRFQKFAWLAGWLWQMPRIVTVQGEEDLERFRTLGVPSARLVLAGNIKYDNALADAAPREAAFRAFVARLGFRENDPILVAGSTWEPEETALAAAVTHLRTEFPQLRLILVPRHVERTEAVVRALSPLRVALRTAEPATEADALVVNTTGELRDWYRLADVVFIGKSLPGVAQTGGQNAGEPAALGLPVVFGPHMENFEALVNHLLANTAAVQIPDTASLAPAIAALLRDPARRAATGARARQVLNPHQGATARTAAAL